MQKSDYFDHALTVSVLTGLALALVCIIIMMICLSFAGLFSETETDKESTSNNTSKIVRLKLWKSKKVKNNTEWNIAMAFFVVGALSFWFYFIAGAIYQSTCGFTITTQQLTKAERYNLADNVLGGGTTTFVLADIKNDGTYKPLDLLSGYTIKPSALVTEPILERNTYKAHEKVNQSFLLLEPVQYIIQHYYGNQIVEYKTYDTVYVPSNTRADTVINSNKSSSNDTYTAIVD